MPSTTVGPRQAGSTPAWRARSLSGPPKNQAESDRGTMGGARGAAWAGPGLPRLHRPSETFAGSRGAGGAALLAIGY